MKPLSDKALERLRANGDLPDLGGTCYSLLQRVARGGMGVVYLADDQKLARRVALKVLDAPDLDGELSRRLMREAQVLARLEHPGIVPVHDVGTLKDGRVYYTMKFVQGRRLDTHIESVSSIPDRLRLFLRICDAVAFAHSRGVLHRDLNPANIMIGPFGEVLVMDWGLAKILSEAVSGQIGESGPRPTLAETSRAAQLDNQPTQVSPVTGHGTVMGTPGFMSPEQARGDNERVNERSDIFSLGVLLQFLLIKRSPAAAATPRMDKSLGAILQKATTEQPENRYNSVTELATDVSRYLDGLPVSACRETSVDKLIRFYRRHSIAILLIAAYLLMRIVLLLVARR